VQLHSIDDAAAKAEVGALIDRLGIFGIDLRPLVIGVRLVQVPVGRFPRSTL
jgi:predicted dinucleotide-binding enzyme